jgi:hypothetical protein
MPASPALAARVPFDRILLDAPLKRGGCGVRPTPAGVGRPAHEAVGRDAALCLRTRCAVALAAVGLLHLQP